MKKLLVFITTFITIFALCTNTIAPVSAQSHTPQTEQTAAKKPELAPSKPTKTSAKTPATKPAKSSHRRKQILANKIYPRTTAVPTKTNVISFDGKDLPIGDFTLPNIYSDLSASQHAIDAGQIVQGYNTIDVTDGKSTYLAGHNPGVMTPLEAYAQIGKVITIHDRNGEARDYRFTNMIPTSTYGHAMSPEAIAYMNTHMSDHEGLVIQWCRNDLNQMQLWILDPVD